MKVSFVKNLIILRILRDMITEKGWKIIKLTLMTKIKTVLLKNLILQDSWKVLKLFKMMVVVKMKKINLLSTYPRLKLIPEQDLKNLQRIPNQEVEKRKRLITKNLP